MKRDWDVIREVLIEVEVRCVLCACTDSKIRSIRCVLDSSTNSEGRMLDVDDRRAAVFYSEDSACHI